MTKWMYYAILFSFALVLGVATTAVAQDNSQQGDAQQQTAQQQQAQKQSQQKQKQQKQQSGSESGSEQAAVSNSHLFITSQSSSQELASSIMGMTIKNSTGKKAKEIGTVNDLIMNEQHQLVGIVVGIGGFLGMGEKNVGLKWDAVENIDSQKDIAVVTVSYKQLENAPAFTTKEEKKQEKKQKKAQQKAQAQQKKMMQPQKKQQQPMAPAQGGNPASGG